MKSCVIAVDGGGSGSRFVLDRRDGRAPIRVDRGAANVFSDFDGALSVLHDGLRALEHAAGGPLCEVPACLALAGVIDDGVAARVAAALPLSHVVVEEDWRAALDGAFAGGDGTLAGIGTGSFLARRSGAAARALGGHGAVLGDEASGAWLGKTLLARSLHAAEGLCVPSPLTEATHKDFGGVSGVVGFARTASASDFATLAPRVAEAAAAGDPIGRAIVEEGGAYLERAARAIGWREGEAFCVTGGLAATYARWLPPALSAARADAIGTALDGALARARQLATVHP